MAERYQKCPTAGLMTTLRDVNLKIMELEGVSGKEAELAKYEQYLVHITTVLEARGNTDRPAAEVSISNVNNSADYKTMESWFRDSVIKFQPSADVNIFLTQLDNGYKLCVTTANKLEEPFVKLAVNKLSTEYSNSLLATNPDLSTYATFKKYMKDNYSTRETVFQVLQHMWEIERRPNEDIHSLGVRFHEKAAETATRITSMYEEKVNENRKSGESKKTMTAADSFLLVGAMQLFQHIRAREPDTYRLLIRDVDDCYTPADLSRKAKLYTDRLDKSDPASQSGAYASQANPRGHSSQPTHSSKRKSTQECWNFRDRGECRKGNNCRFRHDPQRKKTSGDSKPKVDSHPRKPTNNPPSYKPNQYSGSCQNRGKDTNQSGVNHAQPASNNSTEVNREVFYLT